MAENKPQESKQKEKKPQGTKKKKKSQQNGQGTREEAPNAETPATEEDQELADDKPQKGCEQKGKKQKIKKEKGQNTTEGAPKAKTKDNSKDTTPEPASEAAAGEAGETPAVEEEKEEESKTKMADNNDEVENLAPRISQINHEQDDEAELGEDVVGDNEGPDDEADSEELDDEADSEESDDEADSEESDDEAGSGEDVGGDNGGQDDEAGLGEAAGGENGGQDDVEEMVRELGGLNIERDIDRLMKKAEDFSDGSWTEIQYMYRNKPPEYFDSLVDNVMTKTVKDNTGTIDSPINGKLHGVFFCVTLYNGKTLPTISPYGSTRVEIPLNCLIDSKTNLYFADFYCFKEGSIHYNVLVLAQNKSEADVFCRKNLKQLSWDDNEFFRRNNENVFEYKHKYGLWVELFYTEEVDLNTIQGVNWTHDIQVQKGNYSKLPKCKSCTFCNI